jgi:hypothetical protein
LPDQLILKVQAGKDGISETGATASPVFPNIVYWTVDPYRSGGVAAIATAELRPTLFHLWHFIARGHGLNMQSLMDHVIAGGMATVFERDLAGVAEPWSEYPPNVSTSVKELVSLPPTTPPDQWMFRHSDGRRWVGLRAGAYLVDRAKRTSGKSAAELVTAPTDEVLRLALKD